MSVMQHLSELSNAANASASAQHSFPSPSHPSNNKDNGTSPQTPGIVVQTKMRKSCVSFTSNFVGISGFPHRVGESTSSPTVDLEERQWSVRIYPGGRSADTAGYVSVSVALESRGKVRASYRISLINQMGWKHHGVTSEGVKTFTNHIKNNTNSDSSLNLATTVQPVTTLGSVPAAATNEWCEGKFIAREALKNAANGHCVDDTLVISVELTIYGELEQHIISSTIKASRPFPAFFQQQQHGTMSATTTTAGRSPPMMPLLPYDSLRDDLARILFDPITADITLLGHSSSTTTSNTAEEGEIVRIPAHRFILSLRSPVFRAMFASSMIEATAKEILVEDFSAKVIQEMLTYCYTDTCSIQGDVLRDHGEELLSIACKYQIEGLQHLCEYSLVHDHLCIANVATLLALSDLYGKECGYLKSKCLSFIAQNSQAVISHVGFFDHLHVTLCQEVIRALAGLPPLGNGNSSSPSNSNTMMLGVREDNNNNSNNHNNNTKFDGEH